MGKKEVGITLALGGEKEYTQGFTNAVKATKMLNAETKSLAQEFEGSANSMQALQAKQENLTRAQEAFKQKLEAANTGLSNARKEYEKQTEAVEKLKEKLTTAQKSLEKMKENGEEGSESYKKQEKSIEELNTALQKQTQNMLSAQGRVTDWNKKVIESESDVRKNSKALEENNKYLDEAKNSVNGCATSIDEFGKAAKEASSDVEKLGDATDDTAKVSTNLKDKLATAITTKGVSMAVDAMGQLKDKAAEAAQYVVEVGSSFEAAMSEVQAISGAGGSDLEAMSEKAKELGASTQFSASEVAAGFKYMSLAGWSTSDMLSGIDGVLNLAAASGMDLAKASDMVTDYLSAFGMQASESSKMADMLASAQASSNTSAEQLGEAYKNCAANMHSAGQDIETTTSFLEGMANQGLKGSEAGTALTAIMRDMTAKMKDGKIQIGDTAVAVQDASGNYRDLTDVMADVQSATNGLGSAEKNKALLTTFTADSIKGLNLILNEGTDKIAGYEEALRNSGGAAEEMARIMNDNLKGDLTAAESALEGLGIAAYDYIDGPVRGVVQGVTGTIQGITGAITPQRTELGMFLDEVKSANENVEQLLTKSSQTLDTAQVDTGTLETYKEKLLELNAVEDKNEWQKRQIKVIVDELSGTIPELASAFDEESGSINLTNREISDLITNQQQLVMQQAILDAQKESLEAVAQATIAKAKADAAVQAIVEEGGDTLKAYNDQVENGCVVTGEAGEKYGALSNELKDAQEEQKKANEQVQQAQADQEMLQKTLGDLAEEYGISSENAAQTADSLEDVGNTADETARVLDEFGNDITDLSEEEAEAVTEASRQIVEAYDNMQQGIADAIENSISFFDEFSGGTEVTSDQIKANLDSQIEGIQNWSENMQTLAGEIGDGMSQEMYDALAEMGPESANLVQTLVDALNSGTGDFEEIAGKWSEAMQLKEESDVVANYTSAGQKITQGIADGITDGQETVTQATVAVISTATEAAGEAAENASDSIVLNPESITSQADEYRAAGKTLGEAVAQGLGDASDDINNALSPDTGGLTNKAGEYEAAGRELGNAFVTGIASASGDAGSSGTVLSQAAIDAVMKQLSAMKEAGRSQAQYYTDAMKAGQSQAATAGTTLGQAPIDAVRQQLSSMQEAGRSQAQYYTDAISAGQSKATTAGTTLGQAPIDAVRQQLSSMQEAGRSQAQYYADAISAGQSQAASSGSALATAAKSGAASRNGEFPGVGYNISAGVASGIRNGQSAAISAAASMAAAALAAAKAKLGIHSPSRRFRSEVGKQIPAGMAFGIKDNTKLATKEAAQMSLKVYTKATDWMSNYKKKQKVALSDEKWYWKQVLKHVEKGSAAYEKATARYNNAVAGKIVSGVSRTKTTGSGKKKKTVKKDTKTYNNEIYKVAEQYMENEQSVKTVSTKDQIAYWTAITKKLKKKTDAWYKVQAKLKELTAKIDTEIYQKAEKKLSQKESIKDVSTESQIKYWEETAKKLKEGSDAWYNTQAKLKELKKKKDTEIYQKAEKKLSQTESVKDVSVESQIKYWEKTAKRLKKSSEAWYSVQAKIKELKKKVGTVSNMSNLLDNYKKYYNMSEGAEAQYWDKVRKNYKRGTEERQEADQKYLEAKEKYAEKLKEIEDDYKEKVLEVNKKLKEDKAELTEKYNSELESREKAIKDAFGLFDSFESESADGKTLLFNIKSQVAGYQDWTEQINKLSKKGILNEDLLKELTEQGPGISAAIHALNDLTTDELKEYNKAYLAKTKISKNQAKQDTADLKKELSNQTKALIAQADKSKAALKKERDSAIAQLKTPLSKAMENLASKTKTIVDDQTTALVAAMKGANIKKEFANDIKSSKKTSKTKSNSKTTISKATISKATGYKNTVSNDLYTKLAKALGVKVSKTVTNSQKNDILKKLKAKGYWTGGRIRDNLTWMDEELKTKGPEMLVRKSDNAILTRTHPGDEIINADTAANLAQIGKYNLAELKEMIQRQSRMSLQDLIIPIGMAKVNRLMEIGSGENATQNMGIQKMEQILAQMSSLMEECLPYIRRIGQNQVVTLDGDAIVGSTEQKMGSALAMRQRRYRR